MAARKKAGHRRWGPKGGKVPGKHRGDFLSAETRSKVMSKIRSRGTSPEVRIELALRTARLAFEQHCHDLPGRPDFVFRHLRVAVFVDGSFWHGFRFPLWEHKLSTKWREKITKNRARDRRNFAALRRAGWRVIRIWEHQIERDAQKCSERITNALKQARAERRNSSTDS
jgi:DNA mismatch endonuclease, patch repair protein